MRGLAIILLLSIVIGSCVTFCYRDDIADFQAYTKKNLQPDLRGYGDDLAP